MWVRRRGGEESGGTLGRGKSREEMTWYTILFSSTFFSGSLHRQPSVKKIIIPTLRNVPSREGEHHLYV